MASDTLERSWPGTSSSESEEEAVECTHFASSTGLVFWEGCSVNLGGGAAGDVWCTGPDGVFDTDVAGSPGANKQGSRDLWCCGVRNLDSNVLPHCLDSKRIGDREGCLKGDWSLWITSQYQSWWSLPRWQYAGDHESQHLWSTRDLKRSHWWGAQRA